MKVLIDSSVWIDVFSRRPTVPLEYFRGTLDAHVVVTIQAIINEVLAGAVSSRAATQVIRILGACDPVDPSWDDAGSWNALLEIARKARSAGISPAGVVDRMVVFAARSSGASVWTLDKGLRRISTCMGVRLVG